VTTELLGSLPKNEERDAIHLAIAPTVAGVMLRPGQHVLLRHGKAYRTDDNAIGVVDPFLKSEVQAGESFYLCLNPGSITSLKHSWTHPAFAELDDIYASLAAIGAEYSINIEQIIEACEATADGESYGFYGDNGPDMMREERSRIADLYYKLTGVLLDFEDVYFSCAC
tara:strand:- start:946 stop:1452 length:507 start_codon:yes stop_codon:yes gene_type:complete